MFNKNVEIISAPSFSPDMVSHDLPSPRQSPPPRSPSGPPSPCPAQPDLGPHDLILPGNDSPELQDNDEFHEEH